MRRKLTADPLRIWELEFELGMRGDPPPSVLNTLERLMREKYRGPIREAGLHPQFYVGNEFAPTPGGEPSA